METVKPNIKNPHSNLEMSDVMNISYNEKIVDYSLGGYNIFTELQSGRVIEIPLIEFADYLNTDLSSLFSDMSDQSNVLEYCNELQSFIKYSQDNVIYNDDQYNDPEYDIESI